MMLAQQGNVRMSKTDGQPNPDASLIQNPVLKIPYFQGIHNNGGCLNPKNYAGRPSSRAGRPNGQAKLHTSQRVEQLLTFF